MKAAKNLTTGEIFVETPQRLWKKMLSAWRKNHKNPCPMPEDHIMFSGHLATYQIGWFICGQFVV